MNRFRPGPARTSLFLAFTLTALALINLSAASRSAWAGMLAGEGPTTETFPLPGPLISPETAVPAEGPVDALAFADELIELVNQARWENGNLPPYKKHNLIDNAASTHSGNMSTRDFFAHCDLDTGTLPWDRMQAAGYDFYFAGENIAAGYSSPTAALDGWMASSGHRANILSTGFREVGIGYVYQENDQGNVRFDVSNCSPGAPSHGPYMHYWTQDFGVRQNGYPVVINREAAETSGRAVFLYMYGSGWAQEMRFCNPGDEWTDWEAYTPDVPWTLNAGNGVKTVYAEVRSGSEVYQSSDSIVLNETIQPAQAALDNPIYLPFITTNGSTGEACPSPAP